MENIAMKRKFQILLITSISLLIVIIGISISNYRKKRTIESQIAKPINEVSIKTPYRKNNDEVQPIVDISKPDRNIHNEVYDELELPLQKLDIPLDDLPSLQKWASLNYINTAPNELDLNELTKEIKKVPVEIYTEDVKEKDIQFARDLIKGLVLCYSGGSFEEYLELKGGAHALATESESEYVKTKYNKVLQIVESELPPETKKPENLLETMSVMWDILYSEKPYMNKVSFDLTSISFHKQTQDEFDEEKWRPAVHQFPNALQEEAIKRGALSRSNTHRVLENKITPISVFNRDKEIKFFDILITTGRDKEVPFPIMFRYYYEPESGIWLQAFAAQFYKKWHAFRPLLN